MDSKSSSTAMVNESSVHVESLKFYCVYMYDTD